VVNNASACLRWLRADNMEEARQSASLVIAEGHRAGEIISRIRTLAKKAPPQKDWLEINETIGEVIAMVRSGVQRNRISLQTGFANDLPLILGDRTQVGLISRSARVMPGWKFPLSSSRAMAISR
jgi:nitrogen-specific signal transduction histidine kinase